MVASDVIMIVTDGYLFKKVLLLCYEFLERGTFGGKEYECHINNYHIWNIGDDKALN